MGTFTFIFNLCMCHIWLLLFSVSCCRAHFFKNDFPYLLHVGRGVWKGEQQQQDFSFVESKIN